MTTGECGDASSLPNTAAELFQIAALLMGSGAAAVTLVEDVLAEAELDPCVDPETARATARRQVLALGTKRLREADPAGFHAPAETAAGNGCVQDGDLDAAGISHGQLAGWLAGGGRQDLREWLAALAPAQRVIFVERAVLGAGGAETASLLGTGWTPDRVGQVYREALCSLANALAHAPVASLPTEPFAGAARA